MAKTNQDGSYSIAVSAKRLGEVGWVDFYDDSRGSGYQRRETQRVQRGREIAAYFARCAQNGIRPRLFEMTANTRTSDEDAPIKTEFEPIEDGFGFLHIESDEQAWMAIIDGGTRLLGIENALASGSITAETTFDIRLFTDLTVVQEIALFLLINEKQKRVRTDLGVRVVQRYLDDGELSDADTKSLETVVPEVDQWKYEASRISARLNGDSDSIWFGLIQMPGDTVTKPIKLQAFWSSLSGMLDDKDLRAAIDQRMADGIIVDRAEFLTKVLKNFWTAVAEVNPDARKEPTTNVLWGSIGVNGCHSALAEIVRTTLDSDQPDLSQARFVEMVSTSVIADFEFWFSRKGNLREYYPNEKGDATTMTGGSGYKRLATLLEKDWRSALHAAGDRRQIRI